MSTDNEKVRAAVELDDYAFVSDDELLTFTNDGNCIYEYLSNPLENDTSTYIFNGGQLVLKYMENGEEVRDTVNVSLSKNMFTVYLDETEGYQYEMDRLHPNENIEVSKVIIKKNYKRK